MCNSELLRGSYLLQIGLMNAFETGRELSIKVTNSAPKKGSKVLGDINNEPLSNETDSIDFDFPPLDISNSDINEVIDSVGTLCNSGDIELSQSDHDPLSQPLTKNTVDLNVSDLLKDDLHMNEILDHLVGYDFLNKSFRLNHRNFSV